MAPNPPLAHTPEDRRRWEHTGLRLRMLDGEWEEDLRRAIALHVSASRQRQWGIPDLSSNVFKSIVQQIGGVLYHSRPDPAHADQAATGLIGPGARLDQLGLWPLLHRLSTDLVGLREMFLRVDWTPRCKLVFRPVTPDRVVAWGYPERPDVPIHLEELQLREHPKTGEEEWVWEVFDISDPEHPYHLIVDAEQRTDLTEVYAGEELSGAAYKYRRKDGQPVIPYSLYRASKSGRMFDPKYGAEVVWGSLTIAVLWTFFVSCARDKSFPVNVILNGEPLGVSVTTTGERFVEYEPGGFLQVRGFVDAEGRISVPNVVQLAPGSDIEQLQAAIAGFEGRVAEYAGVSAADIQRMSGDPRSGYAISISRAGLRQAQREIEPMLREADLQTIELAAILLNRFEGLSLPEEGYSIAYQSLPKSPEEIREERADLVEKIDRGLVSKVDAYMQLHPGVTRETAMAELERIRRENSLYAA